MILEQRQRDILAAVVRSYTETGLPVASAKLLRMRQFSVSGATLRADMARLEEKGLLYQPHTSAGRIPTDAGFRYFVEHIMPDRPLSRGEQQRLQRELLKLKAQNTRLMRTTAKLLSTVGHCAAVMVNAKTGEVSEFGLRNLLAQVDKDNVDDLCKIAEALDYIDERCETLLREVPRGDAQIFIGKENPLTEAKNYSMVVSRYEYDGQEGIVALIGPKNMKYDKNKSLLEYVKRFLGGLSAVVTVVIMY